MIVSHDRYFMDHMVDHIFAFEGNGKVKDYYGNYSEYFRLRKLEEKSVKTKSDKEKSVRQKPVQKTQNRPSYKELREFENLEKELSELENEKQIILANLNTGIGTPGEFDAWSVKLNHLNRIIDEKSDRWLELSELISC